MKKLLRDMLPVHRETVEHTIRRALAIGQGVIFHFNDGSEVCAFKPSEAKRILRERLGWRGDMESPRQVSEAFKAKAHEGSRPGKLKHA